MHQRLKKILPILTITGIGIYFLFAVLAILNFPGGNVEDVCKPGFSFLHNYWCDLLGSSTHIGEPNASMLYAKLGHVVLSITGAFFFLLLPYLFESKDKFSAKMIRFFGVLTCTVFAFMFTDWHDEVILATAAFGTIAIGFFCSELIKMKDPHFLIGSSICMIGCCSIFIIYETGFLLYWLALLQKITLLFCLGWMGRISWRVLK